MDAGLGRLASPARCSNAGHCRHKSRANVSCSAGRKRGKKQHLPPLEVCTRQRIPQAATADIYSKHLREFAWRVLLKISHGIRRQLLTFLSQCSCLQHVTMAYVCAGAAAAARSIPA